MGINCMADIINRLERMQDEIERMIEDVADLKQEYRRDHPYTNKDNDDYLWALFEADSSLTDVSVSITDACDTINGVKYDA